MLEQTALELGKKAYRVGKKLAPVLDQDLMDILPKVQGGTVGQFVDLMIAWHKGWMMESLKN